ncbi:hypothetical protein M758_5G120000 [Ceratodon purpureus]|nr:hypothetical protein M758_5G120000 [Ceratodon purpureus]
MIRIQLLSGLFKSQYLSNHPSSRPTLPSSPKPYTTALMHLVFPRPLTSLPIFRPQPASYRFFTDVAGLPLPSPAHASLPFQFGRGTIARFRLQSAYIDAHLLVQIYGTSCLIFHVIEIGPVFFFSEEFAQRLMLKIQLEVRDIGLADC